MPAQGVERIGAAMTKGLSAAANRSQSIDERRATGAALAYWETIRGSRMCPTIDDIDPGDIPELWPNAFVLDLRDVRGEGEAVVSGSALKDPHMGAEPTQGRFGDRLPPAIRDRILQFVEAAAEVVQPLADSSSYVNSRGETILYRSAIMPLSDASGIVTHLFGVLGFKTVGTA
jgi:hypothetical protein